MKNDQLQHFPRISQLLLAGEFICQYRFRNEFNYLSDEAYLDQANDCFEPLGLTIETSGQGEVFFLTHINPRTEVAQRSTKATIKSFHEGGEYACIQFFADLNEILQDESLLEPGAVFFYADLLQRIQGSQTHQERLKALAGLMGTRHSSEPEQLDYVLGKMKQWQCIHVLDAREESYVVTGKVAYLSQLMDILEPYTSAPEDEMDDEIEAPAHQGAFDI